MPRSVRDKTCKSLSVSVEGLRAKGWTGVPPRRGQTNRRCRNFQGMSAILRGWCGCLADEHCKDCRSRTVMFRTQCWVLGTPVADHPNDRVGFLVSPGSRPANIRCCAARARLAAKTLRWWSGAGEPVSLMQALVRLEVRREEGHMRRVDFARGAAPHSAGVSPLLRCRDA